MRERGLPHVYFPQIIPSSGRGGRDRKRETNSVSTSSKRGAPPPVLWRVKRGKKREHRCRQREDEMLVYVFLGRWDFDFLKEGEVTFPAPQKRR